MKDLELIKQLQKPMPYKWRVQSFSKNKAQATCVAYVDSRDVQNRLDEACGVFGWQSDYKEVKGNMFAGIGIYNEQTQTYIWKWDCGTESNQDKEKGEASDSFKRAAVKWGIGRFLYQLPIQYVTASEPKTGSNYPFVIDSNGKRVFDLTDHINNKSKPKEKPKMTAAQFASTVKKIREGLPLEEVKKHFSLSQEEQNKLIQQANKPA